MVSSASQRLERLAQAHETSLVYLEALAQLGDDLLGGAGEEVLVLEALLEAGDVFLGLRDLLGYRASELTTLNRSFSPNDDIGRSGGNATST